jgi:HKD family nuclease
VSYEFHLQDPTSRATTYLTEAVVRELGRGDVAAWRTIVAFASPSGISALFEEPTIADFCDRGEVEVIVGLDAITTPEALDRLVELQDEYGEFRARVFHNRNRGLFHPKMMRFDREGGSATLIVGSGNLTEGGLHGNFEAFLVLESGAGEGDALALWDDFVARHALDIRQIDGDAYAAAERNRRQLIRRRQHIIEVEPEALGEEEPSATAQLEVVQGVALEPVEGDEGVEDVTPAVPVVQGRALVAYVPRAGGRWHQVHLNEDVVEEYFHIQPNSHQRLELRHVQAAGVYDDLEIRPVIMSETNRNRRLEIGARRGSEYTEPAPILVFKERGIRKHDYVLLFPGEPGYSEMEHILATEEQLGAGVARVPITLARLLDEWPGSPLLVSD